MKSLSIRVKDSDAVLGSIHDFRLYDEDKAPKYIDKKRTNQNEILYFYDKFPKPSNKQEVIEWIQKIEDENKEIFMKLRKEKKIPSNQGYRIKRPVIQGILTLSREAQEELKRNNEKEKIFLNKAKEYLMKLSKALGTDLIYAIIHRDETALHIHFAFRNMRYFTSSKTTERGLGKSLSSTFYSENSVKSKRGQDYRISYSSLQNTLNFFNEIGFGRGIRKQERIAKGESMYQYINRSVKQLHYDLPREIEEKKKELEEKQKILAKLEDEIKRKEDEIKRKEEEAQRIIQNAERIAQQKIANAEKIAQQKIKEINEAINKTNEMIQNAIDKANQELLEKQKEIEIKDTELTQKNNEIQKKEEEIQKKEEEIQNLLLQITKKQEELAGITQQIQEHQELIRRKKKELEGITNELAQKTQEITKKNMELQKTEEELAEITQKIQEKEAIIQKYKDIDKQYQELYYKVKVLTFQYDLTIDTIADIKERAEQMAQEQIKNDKNHKWNMDI